MSTPAPYHHDGCFACGRANPSGLHMTFRWVGEDRVRGVFVFRAEHEGPPGRAHGGLVALALDDVMSMPLHGRGEMALTGRLETDFRAAAPIGRELVAEAWVAERDGRKVWLAAELRDGETLIAAGRSLYVTTG